jgi:mercuric ion transport protein
MKPELPVAGGRNVRTRVGWRALLATIPSMGAALLPVGVCPACWPAYAGLLSSFGFGFLPQKTYLLPLTAAFLALAVASLAYHAGSRRGYGPLLAGLVASAIVLIGKFALDSTPLLYLGIAALVGASLWNAWPHRSVSASSCPACSHGAGTELRAHATGE